MSESTRCACSNVTGCRSRWTRYLGNRCRTDQHAKRYCAVVGPRAGSKWPSRALPASNESDMSVAVGQNQSGKGRMSFDIPPLPRSRPLCRKAKFTTDAADSFSGQEVAISKRGRFLSSIMPTKKNLPVAGAFKVRIHEKSHKKCALLTPPMVKVESKDKDSHKHSPDFPLKY